MASDILPNGGIYAIVSRVDGRRYVGSSKDVYRRWRRHRSFLVNGTHHSSVMQASWNELGDAAFRFEVLERVTDAVKLLVREQFWIDSLMAANPKFGFNTHLSAIGPRGITRKAETRDKIAAAKTGVPRNREWVERHRQMMIGRTLSEETKARMSEVRAGRPQPSKRGLTYDDAQEIRRLRREEKLTQQQLADRYEISRKSVREILSWNTYTAP